MNTCKYVLTGIALLNLLLPVRAHAEAAIDLQSVLQSPAVSEGHEQRFDLVWFKVRQALPASQRSFVDTWVLLHPQFKIPVVEGMNLKTASGENAIRLMLQLDAKLVSIELKDDHSSFAKLNGLPVAASETSEINEVLLKYAQRTQNTQAQPIPLSKAPLNVNAEVFVKMTSYERANLLVNRRLVYEAAARVLEARRASASYGAERAGIFSWLGFGSLAQAFASTAGAANMSCAADQIQCDPVLYGINSSTSAPYCVSKVKSKPSCAVLSPLRKESLAKDGEALIQSILSAKAKNSKELQAYLGHQQLSPAQFEYVHKTLFKEFNDTITEATKQCEKNEDPSSDCQELIQRRLNFNTYMVDLKSRYEGEVQVAHNEKEKPSLIATEAKTETCNWYCRNKSWALPVGIVGATILSIAGICATKKVSLFGLCTKSTSTASTTVIPTTVTATAPVAPTAPDYSGVK